LITKQSKLVEKKADNRKKVIFEEMENFVGATGEGGTKVGKALISVDSNPVGSEVREKGRLHTEEKQFQIVP